MRPGWFPQEVQLRGHYHGRPAWERRIRWPPAHVTCTPSGSGPGARRSTHSPPTPREQQDDGAWRVWQWLRAFDRRYATLVDLVLAAALFVLCSGWFVERTAPRPEPLARRGADLPAGLPAPGTDDRVPRHCGGGVRPVARCRAGSGRRGAPRRPLHGGARVRVASRRRGRGHSRSGRRDGHGALGPDPQRRPGLRLPHRPRLHGAAGRGGGARPAQPARLAGRAGGSAWSSSATSRRRWPR